MANVTNLIIEQALRLSAEERAAIVERLISSLDSPDPRNEQLWIEEARDRLTAYRSGEIEALSADEVHAQLGLS